jgi:archaemetzincin
MKTYFAGLFLVLLVGISCSDKKQSAATNKLFPLYQAKTKAQNGDWLAEHNETYYDFDSYVASKPVRPDSTRKIIYIYKLGANTKAEDSLLLITCNYLERIFHLKTKITQTFPESCIPDSMKRANSDSTFQVCSHFVLDTLVTLPLPKDAVVGICFTKYDLYPGPGWNFVFGEAYLKHRAGVWSFNRYGDVNDPAQFKTALLRTLKVAAHETGHMFSITHCVRYECDMNGSNSMEETDASPLHYCPECLQKLSWNIGFDLPAHFEGLKEFYTKYGFAEEAVFMQKNMERLEEK